MAEQFKNDAGSQPLAVPPHAQSVASVISGGVIMRKTAISIVAALAWLCPGAGAQTNAGTPCWPKRRSGSTTRPRPPARHHCGGTEGAGLAGADPRDREEFIAFLKSDATTAAKDFICRQLGVIGSEASVPVLAAMLNDPGTADLGRYALERIPVRRWTAHCVRRWPNRRAGRVSASSIPWGAARRRFRRRAGGTDLGRRDHRRRGPGGACGDRRSGRCQGAVGSIGEVRRRASTDRRRSGSQGGRQPGGARPQERGATDLQAALRRR